MRWAYCERWNDVLNELIEPFEESEARRRHEAGELYTAVSESVDQRTILVEIRRERAHVGVRFLDEFSRNDLAFNFNEIDGRLFLHEVISYTYLGMQKQDADAQPIVIESYEYAPSGTVRHETDDARQGQIKAEDFDGIDVTSHWLPVPVFGDYDSIISTDRD